MASFEARLSPLLVALCHELLDKERFAYVESLSNFLVAIHSGRWRQLPTDEQVFWLKRLSSVLIGRDSLADLLDQQEHQVLRACSELIAAEQKALERLL